MIRQVAQECGNGCDIGVGVEHDIERVGPTGATGKHTNRDRSAAEIVLYIDTGNGDVPLAGTLISDI